MSSQLRTGLFPAKVEEKPKPHTMTSVSNFGGPCVYHDKNTHSWSKCSVVESNGQLEVNKCPPHLNRILNADAGETLQQAMTRFSPYSLAACKLKVTNQAGSMDLSGIWIQGPKRDIVLTVSHFPKPKLDNNGTNIQTTTAEVFTSTTGSLSSENESIRCRLFYDFNDSSGIRDFAVFIPCDKEPSRSPVRAVPVETILPDEISLSGTVISFGYNGNVDPPISGHPQGSTGNCGCAYCWMGSGNTVSAKLGLHLQVPDPEILVSGLRVMSVGEWSLSGNPRQPHHTATGWYGISGAGMYSRDKQGALRLVAIFQGGVFEEPNTDKNRAVIIPNNVLEYLRKAGSHGS